MNHEAPFKDASEITDESAARIRDLPKFLGRFARGPIDAMKRPPRFGWPALLVLQIVTAVLSGLCAGFLSRVLWDFLAGATLFPILGVAIGFVYSGFLYFWFSAFRRTRLDYRGLHSIVAVSLIPYFALHVFAGFLPPMDLLGFAFTALLMIVGLTEHFGLPRRSVVTAVGALGILYFVVWMAVQIRAEGVI